VSPPTGGGTPRPAVCPCVGVWTSYRGALQIRTVYVSAAYFCTIGG